MTFRPEETFCFIALLLYAGAAVLCLAHLLAGGRKWSRASVLAAAGGLVAHTLGLALRVFATGRIAPANGYEFLLFFAWSLVLLYLFAAKDELLRGAGLVVLPASVFFLSVAFALSPAKKAVRPLIPALQSGWLAVHVFTALAAYSALVLSFALAVWCLAGRTVRPDTDRAELFRSSFHRYTSVGFFSLTLAIFSGAAWAEQAWGSYWSWDPKETWALLTWLVYVLYFHLCPLGQDGVKKQALVLAAGILFLMFTFLGVNYLLPGLHSYA